MTRDEIEEASYLLEELDKVKVALESFRINPSMVFRFNVVTDVSEDKVTWHKIAAGLKENGTEFNKLMTACVHKALKANLERIEQQLNALGVGPS